MKMKRHTRTALNACMVLVGLTLTVSASINAENARRPRTTTSPASSQVATTSGTSDPCAAFASRAAKAADPAAKCKALFAQARCILIVRCASPLSRGLIAEDEWPADLAPLAEKGIKCLNEIAEQLPEAKKGNDEDLSALESRTDLLLAFARVFAALGGDAKDQKTREALLDACSGLAPWLDDADPGLVESARLWQAVAYRRAGRADRALQLLRPALAPPVNSRIGLWCRIERCRALADRGEFAAGISLAQQLASRTASWLSDEKPETRTQAAQSIDQLRVDLYESWGRRLRTDGKTSLADNASGQAEELRKKFKLTEQLELTESIAGIPDPASEPGSDEEEEP